MRTLNVSISESEYKKFGIKNDKLSFSDFLDIVNRKMAKETLKECVDLAAKYGLSEMTLDEITEEVKAVRKNAKADH